MDSLTPKEIVVELDKYIIGQTKAKMAVAIALRNRWRRQNLPPDLKDEVTPKNIIMIGATGVGKTEIARRLARLVKAPFLKIEASKFTEVGYVGRDVESMIRDLSDISVKMVREEKTEAVRKQAEEMVEERLLDFLLPVEKIEKSKDDPNVDKEVATTAEKNERMARTREKIREILKKGELENKNIEIESRDSLMPMVEIFSSSGIEEVGMQLHSAMGNLFPKKSKKRRMNIANARKFLFQEEVQKLIDMDDVILEALKRVEETGIIFLDEIDKIAGRESSKGPDVSREGVQRDLLPIIEGSTVTTKYGMVKTDHILFIAAGAFNVSKPSDLIPELQGRFPLRVKLNSLSKSDFLRILTEPKNALIKQYIALLKTESVDITFKKDSIEKIASAAMELNSKTEDIGARRLYALMEKLLETISFDAPDMKGDKIVIDKNYVQKRLNPDEIVKDDELKRKWKVGFEEKNGEEAG
ncbi:MAG: ATP-dependent protease ATPase subunit HslU [bacterium]